LFNFQSNVQNYFEHLNSINNLKSLFNISIETDSFIIVPFSTGINKSEIYQNLTLSNSKDSQIFIIYDNNFNLTAHLKVQIKDAKNEVFEINEISILTKNMDLITESIQSLANWLSEHLLCKEVHVQDKIVNLVNEKIVNKPKDTILTAGPLVSNYEKIYVQDAVENGWNNDWGKYLHEFETEFKKFTDTEYAIATSSCTGSLYLSLLALGIGPGDEVIVPELTWVASASAIKYTGAEPVFVDVNKSDWTMSSENIAEAITSKTKAIMPVHLYGNPCEMDEIIKIAKSNNLNIVEDAAPAIGATFKNKKVGSFGDIGCFSFQGAKLLVTGEGGMIVTNDENLYNKMIKLNDHGRVPGTFWIDQLGYKFKMSNMQAAFGLGQLRNISLLINSKRKIYERYSQNLSDISNIEINKPLENSESIFWMTSITVNPETGSDNQKFIDYLRTENIDTRPVFPPISQYPIWNRKYAPQPNAKFISDNSVNLPSGVKLKEVEIDYISEKIINYLEKFGD
tara:strand:- start:8108 stop:9640 length:1533 start_codon:yes stop_codon:yes gene_type:complete